jgi:hypothetical protein
VNNVGVGLVIIIVVVLVPVDMIVISVVVVGGFFIAFFWPFLGFCVYHFYVSSEFHVEVTNHKPRD